MTADEAISALCNAPWRNGKEKVYCYATLTAPVIMSHWNGTHPVEENSTEYMCDVGTTVLVTMASRFGDVGIRARDLEPPGNGYDARVPPEWLTDWRERP